MDAIKWSDPPKPRAGDRRGKLIQFVEALKTRPGEWAMYQPERGHNASHSAQIRKRHPGVETTTRKRPDHQFDIYARWVGNGDGAS